MLRTLTSICLAVLISVSLGGDVTVVVGQKPVVAGCSVNSGDVLTESFEGTGYENTWTESGTPNEDAALPGTSPCSGLGSQAFNSVRTGGGAGQFAYWQTTATASRRYFRCYVYLTSESLGNTDITSFFSIGEDTDGADSSTMVMLFRDTAGTLEIVGRSGGTTGTAVTITTGTWYRVNGEYQPNSGTGLIYTVYNAAGTQIGTSSSATAVNAYDFEYVHVGAAYADNTGDINFTVDGVGVSSSGDLGQ